jgi:hypothetical protein
MFRFTIRDVLWLTAVVALAIGWGIDHRRLSPWRSRAEQVADYLERLEDLAVSWDGTRMIITRPSPK